MKYLGCVEIERSRLDFHYEDEVDCYWIHWIHRGEDSEEPVDPGLLWFDTEFEFADFIRTLQFDNKDEWDLYTPILDRLDIDLEAAYAEMGVLEYMQKPDEGNKED
ncbi:hypothetical protein LA324_05150 [Corynebacterium coyleae]|uniref:hypothetical protein n=1 Tax=Corynebacterium coyleae TaxID=53374 RepID=UPI001CC953C9|nr:hypothetical protein [Corynebacterium coyleae]UBI09997.1 hypothetical protein LA324_05150 [Corynebacterium coyleae]